MSWRRLCHCSAGDHRIGSWEPMTAHFSARPLTSAPLYLGTQSKGRSCTQPQTIHPQQHKNPARCIFFAILLCSAPRHSFNTSPSLSTPARVRAVCLSVLVCLPFIRFVAQAKLVSLEFHTWATSFRHFHTPHLAHTYDLCLYRLQSLKAA